MFLVHYPSLSLLTCHFIFFSTSFLSCFSFNLLLSIFLFFFFSLSSSFFLLFLNVYYVFHPLLSSFFLPLPPTLTFDPFFPVFPVPSFHYLFPPLYTHVSPFFRVYLFGGTKIARARVALSQRCSMSIDTGRGLSRCPSSSSSFVSLYAGLGNFHAPSCFADRELCPL